MKHENSLPPLSFLVTNLSWVGGIIATVVIVTVFIFQNFQTKADAREADLSRGDQIRELKIDLKEKTDKITEKIDELKIILIQKENGNGKSSKNN